MNRVLFIIGMVIAAFAIAACNGNKAYKEGPLALSDSDLGPETKEVIKALPGGLVGDKENARYSNRDQRGQDDGGK